MKAALPFVAALVIVGAAACESKERTDKGPRMFVSTKAFNQGREAGLRDAENSWTDDSAAWTWLWMMEEQYQQGYKQGWREGRERAKFEAEQEEARYQQEQQREADQARE